MRQVNAQDDGSFIDLSFEYLPDGTRRDAGQAMGLVMGDTHVRFADPAVIEATFGPGGIVPTLDPQTLVWHDLFDNYAGNPHHKNNPFIEIAKRSIGYHDVRREVHDTVDFLRKHSKGRRSIVVWSNHDHFFDRWIKDTDWRRDPDNAVFYLETARIMAESAKMSKHGAEYTDPFMHWVGRLKQAPDNIRTLLPNESFLLGPNECGFHGHIGPHGVPGTVKNLSQLGVRVISGHGHAPAIEGGHYRTGTSTYLQLEYNHGPSAWLNTHCVVYANGKRSLINIIGGKWRFD
jgi:hypothetical protein